MPTAITTRTSTKPPATPPAQTTPQQAPSTPTGAWRHPRLDEIARRQAASTLNDSNIRSAIGTTICLIASFVAPSLVREIVPLPAFNPGPAASQAFSFSLLVLRVLFAINIVLNISPLLLGKDNVDDIPLTPSQRAVLGLKPSSAPATPGSQYVTPPRFSRSSTPRCSGGFQASGSPLSSSQRRSQSPLGQSTAVGRSGTGSPYSMNASPLLQKAVGGGVERVGRRSSFGGYSPSQSVGAAPDSSSFMSAPGTPTPAGGQGKGASVGLNNKWLYERGRGSPGRGLF